MSNGTTWILGGSSGIGLATAARLVADGKDVVLVWPISGAGERCVPAAG
jgi:NAD(P)-dependent dehydrogenase (short-subunit alcohol dehydrogenase family)